MPYHVRASIDLSIFVGLWYSVIAVGPNQIPVITRNTNLVDWPVSCCWKIVDI